MSETSLSPEFTSKIEGNIVEKGREFAWYGDKIVGVAKERSVNDYSFPFMDYSKLPQEAIDRINTTAKTEEDLDLIKKASLSLIIEAANQVNNFETENNGRISEDLNSLLGMENALKDGKEFCLKIKKNEPELVLEISKGIMENHNYRDVDDDQASRWLDNTLNDAQERVFKLRTIVQDF